MNKLTKEQFIKIMAKDNLKNDTKMLYKWGYKRKNKSALRW